MNEPKLEVITASATGGLSRAEQVALIGRIVASTHFRRAARLREFLRFVGQRTVDNSSAAIHEQEIGAALFERPEVYDTSVDNIVRVNATELRKRLELYFSTEGQHEPVVVEMPRGSYVLQFRPRVVTAPAIEVDQPVGVDTGVDSEDGPAPRVQTVSTEIPRLHRGVNSLWPVLSLVLMLVAGGILWHDIRQQRGMSPWRGGSATRAFWSNFFDSGQEVDIVLADTSFALAQDLEGRSIPLSSYLNYDYKRVDKVAGLGPDKREDVQIALDRNNGSMGDFIVAQRIIGLEHAASPLRLKFAREYSVEAIKTNSVILIGSRQSNPWVELFGDRMNFYMDYDTSRHQSSVRNRQPKSGEDAVYTRSGDSSQNEGLGVIAFMPDLSRNGSALIIEGTDSQATRAAGEFVTSDADLAAFLALTGGKEFPYFELLLENSQLTGTPLRSRILAYRVYPRTGNLSPPDAVGPTGSQEKGR